MNRKKGKKIKGHEEAWMDRLSNLPDCLIDHILSFMDTKSAVQTCILSKRWVHLWTHLPVIHIDSKCFTSLDNLKKFIAYVLDHRYPNNILGLTVHTHRGILGDDLLDRIVNFVISHGVEMLDLSFGGSRKSLILPQRIFKCQSLRVLKLSHFDTNGVPNSIGLASLKTLTLCNITLCNENYCFDLFSSCVNLENLVLVDVLVIFLTVFNVIAPRLVNLTMSEVEYFIAREPGSVDEQKVVISAPRLTSFSFTYYRPVSLSMDNSPLLENVNLSMFPDDLLYTQEGGSFMFLIDMLRQLGNARSLTVSLGIVKCLSQHPSLLDEQPSPFSKLESLKVVRGRQSRKKIPPNVLNFLVQGSPMAEEVLAKFQKQKRRKCKQSMDD